jgi:hypothetical protein
MLLRTAESPISEREEPCCGIEWQIVSRAFRVVKAGGLGAGGRETSSGDLGSSQSGTHGVLSDHLV